MHFLPVELTFLPHNHPTRAPPTIGIVSIKQRNRKSTRLVTDDGQNTGASDN
jgi:hypothetical protein